MVMCKTKQPLSSGSSLPGWGGVLKRGLLAGRLPAGLHARYALLPGAVLVTPQSGRRHRHFQNPDLARLRFFFSGLPLYNDSLLNFEGRVVPSL